MSIYTKVVRHEYKKYLCPRYNSENITTVGDQT